MSIISSLTLAAGEAMAASMVVEAESGYVVHAEDADALWHPASLTKLMTVLMVFENLRAGEIELSDPVRVSSEAAAQPPTRLGLSAGDTLTVETAVSATILRSANDAAVVLAEALAGSEDEFAGRMTARAKELGMASTVFRNATGLPNREQVTTARDMAVLARHLIVEMSSYTGYFADTSLDYGGERLPTINGFVASYPGASGMKTGFTCASGYNIVASATRKERTLIGVHLGAESAAKRTAGIRQLLDKGFRSNPETASEAAILGDLLPPTAGARAGPPTVIPQARCGPRATPRVASHPEATPPVASHSEKLPGWGLLIGSFNGRDKADEAARKHRARLGGIGQTVVVERRQGRARGYSALLVNLSRKQAHDACAALRKQKSYCLALAPPALNNPRALWR